MADPAATSVYQPPPQASQSDVDAATSYFRSAIQPPAPAQPISGPAQDTVMGSLQTIGGKLLNYAGFGAPQGWGADPDGLLPETKAALSKSGMLTAYQKDHQVFVKSAGEALIRPAVAAVGAGLRIQHAAGEGLMGGLGEDYGFGPKPFFPDHATGLLGAGQDAVEGVARGVAGTADLVLNRVIPAAAGYVGAGLKQASEEAQGEPNTAPNKPLSSALGAASELVYGGAEGGFIGAEGGIPHVAEADHVETAAKARSVGAMGESEPQSYGAEPLTPENLQARTEAAKDIGQPEPPPPLPPAPDIPTLARRIDPETFQQFDALAAEADEHRATIATLGAERVNSPEAIQAQTDIDAILGKVNGVEDRLTKVAAERLAEAQDRLEAATSADTLEMSARRGDIQRIHVAMSELAPAVSEATRRAAEMAPQLIEGGGGEIGAEAGQAAETTTEKGGAESAAAPAEQLSAPPSNSMDVKTYVDAYLNGEGRGDSPNDLTMQQFAANHASEIEQEFKTRSPGAAPEGGPAKATRYGNLKPIEGSGDLTTRGLSREVEASAIEKKLTDDFGELPAYRTLNMKEQAALSAEALKTDYAKMKGVLYGRAPPKGIHPAAAVVALEEHAVANGDVATLQEIARSPFAGTITTAAQAIRIQAERDKASPVDAIREVQEAREAALPKGSDPAVAKSVEASAIKAEVRKAAPKIDEWAAFIDSIRCT